MATLYWQQQLALLSDHEWKARKLLTGFFNFPSSDFVTKEIPIPAETMDQEMQTDETCFEDNGYLPIVGKTPDPIVVTREEVTVIEGQEQGSENFYSRNNRF